MEDNTNDNNTITVPTIEFTTQTVLSSSTPSNGTTNIDTSTNTIVLEFMLERVQESSYAKHVACHSQGDGDGAASDNKRAFGVDGDGCHYTVEAAGKYARPHTRRCGSNSFISRVGVVGASGSG